MSLGDWDTVSLGEWAIVSLGDWANVCMADCDTVTLGTEFNQEEKRWLKQS